MLKTQVDEYKESIQILKTEVAGVNEFYDNKNQEINSIMDVDFMTETRDFFATQRTLNFKNKKDLVTLKKHVSDLNTKIAQAKD